MRKTKFEKLLNEHLAQERQLWRNIKIWRSLSASYQWDCYRIGHEIGTHAHTVIGLQFKSAGNNTDGIHEAFISWIFRLALENPGRTVEKTFSELKIVESTLNFGGSQLVTADNPETVQRALDEFRNRSLELARSSELKSLADSVDRLQVLGEAIRDKLDDILLFPLIAGKCRVCRKHAI